MLAIKKKKEIKKQPKSKLGWWYGETETLAEITTLFNDMEAEGYVVCNVDIEEDTVNGSWRFIYKIVEE